MTKEITEDFIYYKTWDAVMENFLDNENTSELFEVTGILNDLCQGELIVTQYFNILNRYWQ